MPDHASRPLVADWLGRPAVLAVLVTLANAAKPVVVDDTAYLFFARHIAAHPLDPYGFEIFWYHAPEPAIGVLAPPVLVYWLAAGIRLFGEHLFLLKLWLFPFPLLLAFAARFLLARFARGTERVLLPAVVLGPGVLPFLNFMLDVPALALQCAAVAVFVWATGRPRVRWAAVVGAGVLAGLAAQTKYSVLCLPLVLLWYGRLTRTLRPAAVVGLVAAGLFVAWEWFVTARYGQSHFLVNAGSSGPAPDGRGWVERFLANRGGQLIPLLGQLGGTAGVLGLFGLAVLGVRKAVPVSLLGLAVLGAAALTLVPFHSTVVVPGARPGDDPTTTTHVLFVLLGMIAVVAGALAAITQVTAVRGRTAGVRARRSPDGWFLAGWLAVELAWCLASSPFPAGRRVLGVTFVLALVLGRLWAVRLRRRPGLRSLDWWPWAVAASGVSLLAIDAWDARAEQELAEEAAEYVRANGPGGAVWFVGHWGFQYYCDRAGMVPYLPGKSAPRAGDWLVLPVYPHPDGFYRPDHGGVRVVLGPGDPRKETLLVSDDVMWAQTIPNLYGGGLPVSGRDYPRLRVALYRYLTDQPRPTAAPPS